MPFSRAYLIGGSGSDATVSDVDYYLDSVNGSDTNDGLTLTKAWRTVEHADATIPLVLRHRVRVFQAPGTYPINRLYAWGARIEQGGSLQVLPLNTTTCFEIILSDVAEASTTEFDIRVAGLTQGVYNDYWIIMDSGAAVGEVRSVRNNTTGSIYPVTGFSNTPVEGDAFRIVRPAVIYQPTGVSSFQLVGGQTIGVSELLWGQDGSGVQIRCVRLDGSAGVSSYRVSGPAWVSMIGLDRFVQVELSGHWMCGLPLESDYTFWYGAGIQCGDGNNSAVSGVGGTLHGFVCTKGPDPIVVNNSFGEIYGVFSRQTTLIGGRASHLRTDEITIWAQPTAPFLVLGLVEIGKVTTSFAPGDSNIKELLLTAVPVGFQLIPRVRVRVGCRLVARGFIGTSYNPALAPTVSVESGGEMLLETAPTQLGDPVLADWDIGDGMPVNRSYFGVVGARRFFDGRLIERIF